ncbi:MAG: hypothetical protein AB8C84_02605 [Oligoflexales bacterium]
MIRKFLTIGAELHLSSAKWDDDLDQQGRTVDLYIPLDVFWEMQETIEKINYLKATHVPASDIKERYRKVFKIAAPYALFEIDRLWLYKESGSTS